MQIYRNKEWRDVNENSNGEVLIPFKTIQDEGIQQQFTMAKDSKSKIHFLNVNQIFLTVK